MTLEREDVLRNVVDRMIRESLQHPENLRGLLQQAVPDLADGFDVTQAELLERDFPVDDWRCREADLPFRIPYKIGDQTVPALVVVLIEHQSDTDAVMPLRMLYFATVYWDKQWKEWAQLRPPRPPLRLHPVLPIVFYTGHTPWGSNRTLVDLLGPPQVFHSFAPTWEPLFWNLADETPEELLATTNAWVQVLSVLRAELDDAQRFQAVYAETAEKLLEVATQEKPRWFDLMRILFTWAISRRPEEEYNELLKVTKKHTPSAQLEKEFDEMIAKKLGPSITDLAAQRGRQEGRMEAQLETWRESLKMVLAERFNDVPETLVQQIDALDDSTQLKAAVQRASVCQSLDQFQL